MHTVSLLNRKVQMSIVASCFLVAASAMGDASSFPAKLKVVSISKTYLAPLSEAITEQLAENETYLDSSVNVPGEPVFWSFGLDEEQELYRKALGLSDDQIQLIKSLGYFPSSLYKELSPQAKRIYATYQTRNQIIEALADDGSGPSPIQEFLPLTVRALLNKVPVEVKEVEVVRLEDYLAVAPELKDEIPAGTPNDPQYPQCYSATLSFYGLQKYPKEFFSRDTLLGLQSADDAQIEIFRNNGFEVLKIKNESELQFGDVITSYSQSHTFVYLAEDLVFEKPNGSGYSPWRIMLGKTQSTYLDSEGTFVLRKPKK